MHSPVPGLDNREFALVAWLLVALLLGLFNDAIRHSLGQVVGTLLHWKILLIFAAMLVYVGALVLGLASINLWRKDLLSETVYWTFVTGFVLPFRAATTYDDDDFFKKIILAAMGLTVLTEFLVNLRPMSLIPELLLVPILVLLGGTLAVAQSQPKYRQARGCLEVAAVLIGLALLAYVIVVYGARS